MSFPPMAPMRAITATMIGQGLRGRRTRLARVLGVCSMTMPGLSHASATGTAIARLAPTSPLSSVVSRFVRRADRFPLHPVTEDDEIRPLTSARDFITAARRYRNCLAKEMLDEALAGHVAFAEVRGRCIAEFRPLSLGKGWVLHDVHVERNGFVDGELAAVARLKCESIGIPNIHGRESGEAWRRYRRFVRSGCWLDRAA